jgi:Ca2+:H+ antiporter
LRSIDCTQRERRFAGEPPKELVLVAITFVVNAVTLGSGRTHMMQGAVHLVLFAAFLFLAVVP